MYLYALYIKYDQCHPLSTFLPLYIYSVLCASLTASQYLCVYIIIIVYKTYLGSVIAYIFDFMALKCRLLEAVNYFVFHFYFALENLLDVYNGVRHNQRVDSQSDGNVIY